MNNGNTPGQDPSQAPFNQHALVPQNQAFLTPEAFQHNMNQIQQARDALAQLEMENAQNLMNYYELQRLQAIEEQGRLAR